MELCFLKNSALDTLKNSLPQIFDKYFVEENNSWLAEVCGENPFVKFREVRDFELTPLDKGLDVGSIDLNNCKIIYKNLSFLKHCQAADERFWAGLCHGAFYDYVRRRWSYGEDKIPSAEDAVRNIKTRFFFNVSLRQALSTNSLAKYWWAGHIFSDEGLDVLGAKDFYTKIFSIMTRSFIGNAKLRNGFMKFLKHFNSQGMSLDIKTQIRPAMSELNKSGGAIILDCLTEKEIAAIMIEYVEKILAKKSVVIKSQPIKSDDKVVQPILKKPVEIKPLDDTRTVKLDSLIKVVSLEDGKQRNYRTNNKLKKNFSDIFNELFGKKINSVVTIREKSFKIVDIK